jgi:DNA-binding CsgD family transcriptional regulator
MTAEAHSHEAEQLCEAGLKLYGDALRRGSVPEHEARPVPCVLQSGALRTDLENPQRLRPVAPALVLPHLLRNIAEAVARQRRAETQLTEAFEPLLDLELEQMPTADAAGISVLKGYEQINHVISEAMLRSSVEVLAIQPGGKRPVSQLTEALPREQEMLSRGSRMRTLYQHTTRHDPAVLAHYERLDGDVEVRTLDEVPDRLIVLDRQVAFIPASADRTLAVEIRHPPLVAYLANSFDHLFRLASPMYPHAAQQPSVHGITPRQRAIARLLIEGHTDAVIADRLGLNIRTARVHIAKLAATLGSESRAQLGYLIGQSGILDQGG